MMRRPTQCVPCRRPRRDGLIALSIGAFALAAWSGSAAGTAATGGAAAPVTDVAFHDGADVPIQALVFFPVVVLNADRAPPAAVRALAQAGSHPLARLAVQPRSAPADLLAAARRLAVAGYEGALVEIPAGAAAWTPRSVAEAIAALRTIWPQGPLLLAGDPRVASEAAPQLSGVVVSGALARAAELTAFARRELATGRATPLPIVDVESVPAGRRVE